MHEERLKQTEKNHAKKPQNKSQDAIKQIKENHAKNLDKIDKMINKYDDVISEAKSKL